MYFYMMYIHIHTPSLPPSLPPSLHLSSGFSAATSPSEDDPQSLDQPPERVSTLVKTEIEKHLKGKERVEKSLPQSVDVGPFHINTDSVRLALAKKHKEIVRALLEFLVLQLRIESEQVNPLLMSSYVLLHL